MEDQPLAANWSNLAYPPKLPWLCGQYSRPPCPKDGCGGQSSLGPEVGQLHNEDSNSNGDSVIKPSYTQMN